MTDTPRTVFILGAGFSRAVSSSMPLTDELGSEVVDRLGLTDDPRAPLEFRGGDFERWMSHLAEDQPFLSAHENLENRALFLRVSEAIADVLDNRQQAVLGQPWPAWFPRFIRLAHQQLAAILTFNYDTLLECAVATGLLYDPGIPEQVAWTELTDDVPGWPAGVMRAGATPAATLRLLKLHGSLNWYWVPEDITGASVARRILPGRFGAPEPYTEENRRRDVPGRTPLVIPPATVKSAFYRNPLMRELWRQSFDLITDAQEVVLFGYSVPTGDLTVADMLRTGLARSEARLTIVDPCADAVRDRLQALGIATDRVSTISDGSDGPAATFVDAWSEHTGAEALRSLCQVADEDLDVAMQVTWGANEAAAVVGVDTDGSTLVFEDPAPGRSATRPVDFQGRETLPTLRQVLEGCGNKPLRVRSGSSSVQTVIGHGQTRVPIGYGDGRWHVLYTDGLSPNLTKQLSEG